MSYRWKVACALAPFLIAGGGSCVGAESPEAAARPEGRVALALASADPALTRVETLISDGGREPRFAPLRAELTFVEGVATGLILNVPAGPERGIAITAFEGDEPRCHGGAMADVVVGDIVQVRVVLQCFGEDEGAGGILINGEFNHNPRIEAVVASGTSAENDNTLDLHAMASDPDGDRLVYQWHDECEGEFGDPTAPATLWRAPAAPAEGPCEVAVQILDNRGGQAAFELEVLVVASQALAPPRILELLASPASVRAGEAVVVSWRTENAQACQLSDDPEAAPLWLAPSELAAGTREFAPWQSTTYALTCTGAGEGSDTLERSVAVESSPAEESPHGWQVVSVPTGPPARQDMGLAYDPVRRVALLFSGGDGSRPLRGDTWEWDGELWHERSPEHSPPPLMDHALAFDEAGQQAVLFGGFTNVPWPRILGATWLWDGGDWREVTTAAGPSARIGSAMAYDPERGVVVLFGGRANYNPHDPLFGDTWQWDGAAWKRLAPTTTPSPRSDATLFYDPLLGGLVLFGGRTGSRSASAETWLWEGAQWRLLGESPAAERFDHAMLWDPSGQRALLVRGFSFGPSGAISSLSDLWQFGPEGWTPLIDDPLPGPSAGFALFYDEVRGRPLIFGGLANAGPSAWLWERRAASVGDSEDSQEAWSASASISSRSLPQ